MSASINEVTSLLERSSRFISEKEQSFLESILSRLNKGKPVTFGQESWLKNIGEKYSVENIAQEEKWLQDFDNSRREIAIKVAGYYSANPPYFASYVARIATNPDGFVLSRKEWHKLCENKYALKIRKMYDSELRFKVGDCVQIRKTNRIPKSNYPVSLRPLGDRTAFIIETDPHPITRAAKGSRTYKILLVGSTVALSVHEADIKRSKKIHAKKN